MLNMEGGAAVSMCSRMCRCEGTMREIATYSAQKIDLSQLVMMHEWLSRIGTHLLAQPMKVSN